jgi:hypothetical protein
LLDKKAMSIDLKKYYLVNGCFLSFLLVFTIGVLKQQKLLMTLSYATVALVLGFLLTFIVLNKSNSHAEVLVKPGKKKG